MNNSLFTMIYRSLLARETTSTRRPGWADYQLVNIIEYYNTGTEYDKMMVSSLAEEDYIETLLNTINITTNPEERGLIKDLFRLSKGNDDDIDHQINIIYAFWTSYVDKPIAYQQLIQEGIKKFPSNHFNQQMLEALTLVISNDDDDLLLYYPAHLIVDLIDIIDRIEEKINAGGYELGVDIYTNMLNELNPQKLVKINTNNQSQNIINKIRIAEELKNKLTRHRVRNLKNIN